MPIEKRPANPRPKDYVPPDSKPYQVKDGDSWVSVARANGMEPWDLIYANFNTRDPAEVNWYLSHYVGCNRPTQDLRNWMFSSSARPGVIHIPVRVVKMPPPTATAAKLPSRWGRFWAGIGKAHSGDLFVIGAHDLTAKVYNLGDAFDDPGKAKNALINVNGWKFGAGLGGDVAGVFVIAHGYDEAHEMKGVDGGWDFDIAIAWKLGDFLKGVRGLGRVVDTYEKYKKLRYLTENAVKNLGITKEGVYTVPIPGAGWGLHIWGGYKFGDVTVISTGVGVP